MKDAPQKTKGKGADELTDDRIHAFLERHAFKIFCVVFAWISWRTFLEHDLIYLSKTIGQIFGLPFLIWAVVSKLFGDLKGLPYMKAGFLLLMLVGYGYFSTSSWSNWRWLLDFVGIVGGVVLYRQGYKLFGRLRPHLFGDAPPSKFRHGRAALGFALSCWVGLSVVYALRPVTLPSDLSRFNANPKASLFEGDLALTNDKSRIGLALSGGGYRAAVFHAGTLHAIESLGIRVDKLSTVSGGSIIGAYYAVGGDPIAFKNAVAAGHFNLKRELLLIQNVVRMICPMRARDRGQSKNYLRNMFAIIPVRGC